MPLPWPLTPPECHTALTPHQTKILQSQETTEPDSYRAATKKSSFDSSCGEQHQARLPTTPPAACQHLLPLLGCCSPSRSIKLHSHRHQVLRVCPELLAHKCPDGDYGELNSGQSCVRAGMGVGRLGRRGTHCRAPSLSLEASAASQMLCMPTSSFKHTPASHNPRRQLTPARTPH